MASYTVELHNSKILAKNHELVNGHDLGFLLDLLKSGVIAGRVAHPAVVIKYGTQVLLIVLTDLLVALLLHHRPAALSKLVFLLLAHLPRGV